MKKLLSIVLLFVSSLAHGTACQTFAAGDLNYISKLNLLANGCAPVVGLPSLTLIGTSGAGYLQLANQSSAPSTPATSARFFVDASNRFSWIGINGYVRTFDGTANTASRVYTLQNRNGTIADDTDLAAKAALAGSSSQAFATAGLTTSGHVGLGSAVNAGWFAASSNAAAIQIGGAAFYGTADRPFITQNLYSDGSVFKVIATGLGSQYTQFQGTHIWKTSASVTAGSTASLVTFMTLDASGILNLPGTTDASSSTTGTITTAGGLGVAKKLYVGTSANIGTTLSLGTSVGANSFLVYNGGGTSNYGYGIQASELQAFVPAGGHFSFNGGGTINASGTNELLRINDNGHIKSSTSTPALTSCGSSPSITGSDSAGTVIIGTGGPTGCVITFAVAYFSTAPHCVVTWQTNIASMQYTISTTAITLVQTATSSNKVNYVCFASI